MGGIGVAAYAAAPFWRRIRDDMGREVKAPAFTPDPSRWPDSGIHAAWLGHSTVLLKIDGATLITDPVLTGYAGIDLWFGTLGIKRLVHPGLALDRLPPVDLILLSHAHMDHFNLATLRALEGRRTRVVTASRTSDLLRVDRYQRVDEIGWGESTQAGPLRVTAFRVNHWGARVRSDTWRGYNGYLIESGRRRVLFGGDTAYTPLFGEVRTSRPIDLGIMPIGAYNPWIRRALQSGTGAGDVEHGRRGVGDPGSPQDLQAQLRARIGATGAPAGGRGIGVGPGSGPRDRPGGPPLLAAVRYNGLRCDCSRWPAPCCSPNSPPRSRRAGRSIATFATSPTPRRASPSTCTCRPATLPGRC
jgi:L-ascorbate metabolism protein UlaG (beta-lactamase superfamily)